ncbi:hypothetical protein LCGC14_1884890 [marine sediment metagenome]|uniref:Uncharacterized protein n=1 Tax=marine sediment metagenome TaxID=412755 RepID=A0A0F9IF45_9ZZZZ
MIMIAIDPGQGGGIAWTIAEGIQVEKMPQTTRDISDLLETLKAKAAEMPEPVFAWLENVGKYMPGNSGPSAVKFGGHCGELRGVLTALKIPFDKVLPAKWEHWLIGKPNYEKIPKEIQGKARKAILSKRKTERKNKIKEKAQQLNPNLKIILATSDAVGMLHYVCNK